MKAALPHQPQDYREWLQRALSERCRANPRYSLRAFARDLKLSPASVSGILNGKKGLSPLTAQKTARLLGLNAQEAELFCNLVDAQDGRAKATRSIAKARLQELRYDPASVSLQMDAFQAISDWHHLAFLQLVQVKDFRDEEKWIAQTLGIHPKEVEPTIARLTRLSLLSRDESGRFQVSSSMVFAPDGIPSEAIRKFHRQVLEKAIESISNQTLDERYLNTTVMPVRSRDLTRAKAKIKQFHKEFDAEFTPTSHDPGDQVYALAVQFFSLSPSLKKESSL